MIYDIHFSTKIDVKGETAFGCCSSPHSVSSERRKTLGTIRESVQDGTSRDSSLFSSPMCPGFPMDLHGETQDKKQPAHPTSSGGDPKSPPPPIGSQLSTSPAAAAKKKPWRKPKDMPKRPLSAYNLFFADERKQLLKAREPASNDLAVSRDMFSGNTSPPPSETKGKKLGFAGLARSVAAKWKTLDAEAKSKYEKQADVEKARYKAQMKDYNEQRLRAQQQASMITVMEQGLSSPVWPAMPQTIASLGNIYDSTTQTGMGGYEGAASMETSGSGTGLVMPKGSYFGLGMSQETFPPPPAMGSEHPPSDTLVFPSRLHQPEAKRIRRTHSAGPVPGSATMVNWNDDTALARRLSQPANISILAAELGQDQVDFFLRSLREEDEDEDSDEQQQQRRRQR